MQSNAIYGVTKTKNKIAALEQKLNDYKKSQGVLVFYIIISV